MQVEVTVAGNMFLNRGWQPFGHAHGLHEKHTLYFRYDGIATLYVRVFGEDGRRLECCSGRGGPCGAAMGAELALGLASSTTSSSSDYTESSDSPGSRDDDSYKPPSSRRARSAAAASARRRR